MSSQSIDNSLPSLLYFGVYGKGEAMRFLLWHAKVEYNNITVTSPDFQKWKQDGSLPAGQLPLWVESDGSSADVNECKYFFAKF